MARKHPGPRRPKSHDGNGENVRGTWGARLRLWVAIDGRVVLGPGKLRLLDAIAATKSLSAAAERLHMSYRLAWKHLRVLEERTGLTVVEPQRGGSGGGGTALTEEGHALLEAYRRFQREVDERAADSFERHFARWGAPARSDGADAPSEE